MGNSQLIYTNVRALGATSGKRASTMKAFLSSLVLVSVAAVAPAADNSVVAGKWQVHISIAGNENDMTCTMAQKDSDLTGACNSDQGTVNISGKVDGKNITWIYKSEYNGGPITLTYKGTLAAANKISGTVTVEEYSVDGEFTATQAN